MVLLMARTSRNAAVEARVTRSSRLRHRSYQLPGFPPRSAGSAGPTRTKPAL